MIKYIVGNIDRAVLIYNTPINEVVLILIMGLFFSMLRHTTDGYKI
jgi:hypothetical protein